LSKLFQTSVTENKQLAKNHYLITLHPLKRITKPEPGQFFMLSADNSLDPLLKRPFSLHRWLGPDFQILYRIVGKATEILKEQKKGDVLEIMGPLGNGFPLIKRHDKPILIGGGLGIAPIFAFAETIADKKPLFFIGAKTKKELLCVDELKSIGINPIISTDNGTLGRKGRITDVLRDFLSRYVSTEQFDPELTAEGLAEGSSLPDLVPCPTDGTRVRSGAGLTRYCLYACGPKLMLRELSDITKKYGLRAYVALEENMACGIGACLSCVVNTKEGLKRVCKEGPVFPIEEIIW
jgi:dihydroorotate dehydrogenase electron transfer subunit